MESFFFFNTDQVHYLEKNKARDFTKHRPYVSSENETSDYVLTEGVIFFFLSCSFCTLRTGVWRSTDYIFQFLSSFISFIPS
jgi:hypothetical protein